MHTARACPCHVLAGVQPPEPPESRSCSSCAPRVPKAPQQTCALCSKAVCGTKRGLWSESREAWVRTREAGDEPGRNVLSLPEGWPVTMVTGTETFLSRRHRPLPPSLTEGTGAQGARLVGNVGPAVNCEGGEQTTEAAAESSGGRGWAVSLKPAATCLPADVQGQRLAVPGSELGPQAHCWLCPLSPCPSQGTLGPGMPVRSPSLAWWRRSGELRSCSTWIAGRGSLCQGLR